MNRNVNPNHCYETEDGHMYQLVPAYCSPEWHVVKDGRKHQTFSSLMAAKGWMEHVLDGDMREPDPDEERDARADWEYDRDR